MFGQDRFALVVGSYEFKDPSLRQLVAPANDAESLANTLGSADIGAFQVTPPLINEPSHIVSRAIESFFANRNRNDLLLLYYSGHGIKDEDGRLFLTTSDTERRLLRSTAVSSIFVNDVMKGSRSRRQVLLLDCCFSGAFAKGMIAKSDQAIGSPIGTKEAFEGRGRVVLTASDAMQYAFEGDDIDGEGKRSVFTRTLIEGLESGLADLDGDGWISLDELYNYVDDWVTASRPHQSPRKYVFDVQGEIFIAKRQGVTPHSPHRIAASTKDKDYRSRGDETISEYVARLAKHSSRRAIIGAWNEVEKAAREALDRAGVPQPTRRSSLAPALAKEGLMPLFALERLNDLRYLRKDALSSSEFNMPEEHAARYGKIAERLVASISI